MTHLIVTDLSGAEHLGELNDLGTRVKLIPLPEAAAQLDDLRDSLDRYGETLELVSTFFGAAVAEDGEVVLHHSSTASQIFTGRDADLLRLTLHLRNEHRPDEAANPDLALGHKHFD